ncbi:hypothetical protein [Cytobacillus gottheilii]|uniref:hypothetical protein n=1 Tax=Cytobacillus gottheilii TaxID=859144 RepID=UPI00346407C0
MKNEKLKQILLPLERRLWRYIGETFFPSLPVGLRPLYQSQLVFKQTTELTRKIRQPSKKTSANPSGYLLFFFN